MIKSRTGVFIVDDHPLVRDWLARLINEESDLIVCGGAASAAEAMRLLEHAHPGIIIIDIGLPGKSGLELIRFLTERNPEELILVFSMHDEAVYANRAFRAGARGYVNKREATEKVVVAVRRVLSGEVYVSESFAQSLASGLAKSKTPALVKDVNLLSDRELEVFRLLAAGKENTEIARDLSISLKTVQTYCSRIKEKLNFKNATELLQAATRWSDAEQVG